MRGHILAAALIALCIPANAQSDSYQDIRDPDEALANAIKAERINASVKAIRSFGLFCVVNNKSENFTLFHGNQAQAYDHCPAGKKIVVVTNFGVNSEIDMDSRNFDLIENMGDIGIRSLPPCVHTGHNHTEYSKTAGAFFYRWCEPDPVPSGQTNEDLLVFIGGSFRLIGSHLVACSTLPADVQSSAACDGTPAP